MFSLSSFEKSFEKIDNLSESATDESFLVEQLGVEVSIVEGNAKNIKVTNKEDLILVEKLLKKHNV